MFHRDRLPPGWINRSPQRRSLSSPAAAFRIRSAECARRSADYAGKTVVTAVVIKEAEPHEFVAVLREAALAGVGVVQLPGIMIWEDIRAGRLVPVLPQWPPRRRRRPAA